MDPSAILALMIAFAPPGQSLYSQVVVPDGTGPACDDKASLLCADPKPHPHWDGLLTRPETREEALVRYAQIASLIAEVADNSTWRRDRVPDGCPSPVRLPAILAPERCQPAMRSMPWGGSASELARYTLTVTAHESGFRRDVHAGRGANARGDRGLSTCLGQILRPRRDWRSARGYTWESLTGLDDGSTRRCLETVADYLGHAYAYCVGPASPAMPREACILATYGGVRTLDRRIRERMATYLRFGRRPLLMLPEDAQAVLEARSSNGTLPSASAVADRTPPGRPAGATSSRRAIRTTLR